MLSFLCVAGHFVCSMAQATPTSIAGGLVLTAGQSYTSNGVTLIMQTEGNLVLYQGSTAIWASNCIHQVQLTSRHNR